MSLIKCAVFFHWKFTHYGGLTGIEWLEQVDRSCYKALVCLIIFVRRCPCQRNGNIELKNQFDRTKPLGPNAQWLLYMDFHRLVFTHANRGCEQRRWQESLFFVLFNGAISGFHINCMNYMYTLAKICSGLLHTTVQLADNYISKTKPGKWKFGPLLNCYTFDSEVKLDKSSSLCSFKTKPKQGRLCSL